MNVNVARTWVLTDALSLPAQTLYTQLLTQQQNELPPHTWEALSERLKLSPDVLSDCLRELVAVGAVHVEHMNGAA